MSKLDPNSPDFIKKMHQYNKKFRDYVAECCRTGRPKEEILELKLTREVALFYFYGDQTEEPDTVVQTTINCGC